LLSSHGQVLCIRKFVYKTYGLYTANDLFEIKNILVYLNSNKTLKVLDYHLPKY